MMKPIDLYVVPPSPPCRAVIIAAKYMKLDINLIYVDLNAGEQREDWFVKLNPQHCLPTINDNGYILWESRAIMAYFANQYAPNNDCYPSNPNERAFVDRMLQFDLNVLYRSLGEFLIPIVREGKPLTNLNPIKGRKVTETLNYLDTVLEQTSYVAGHHLTLADFSSYFSLEFADKLKYDFTKFVNVTKWFERMKRKIIEIDGYMNYTVERTVCPMESSSNDNKCEKICERNEMGKCNLDKLCIANQSNYGKVICRESDQCKVVTNYTMNQTSKNLFDLLKSTGGKLFDSPE